MGERTPNLQFSRHLFSASDLETHLLAKRVSFCIHGSTTIACRKVYGKHSCEEENSIPAEEIPAECCLKETPLSTFDGLRCGFNGIVEQPAKVAESNCSFYRPEFVFIVAMNHATS